MSELGNVWQDGDKGWRWTTADGRFDSKLYPTKRAAMEAMQKNTRPAKK